MQKFFQFYVLATVLLFSVVSPVFAVGSLESEIANKAGYATQGVDEFTLSETIGRAIKVVLGFVGTIFFALTVYSGFLWMTAQGNSEQVEKAKDILKASVIGIIIVVSAYSITTWVLMFTAQSVAGGSPTT